MNDAAAVKRPARRVALDALRRIEDDGAYANLVLGPMLSSSGLTGLRHDPHAQGVRLDHRSLRDVGA